MILLLRRCRSSICRCFDAVELVDKRVCNLVESVKSVLYGIDIKRPTEEHTFKLLLCRSQIRFER